MANEEPHDERPMRMRREFHLTSNPIEARSWFQRVRDNMGDILGDAKSILFYLVSITVPCLLFALWRTLPTEHGGIKVAAGTFFAIWFVWWSRRRQAGGDDEQDS